MTISAWISPPPLITTKGPIKTLHSITKTTDLLSLFQIPQHTMHTLKIYSLQEVKVHTGTMHAVLIKSDYM